MRRTEPWYETAQVCLNGHTITRAWQTSPVVRQDFCDRCGAPTITECPSCHASIRGDYQSPTGGGLYVPGDYPPAAFCHACGKPYPWTQRKLQAAKEYADELEQLDQEEKALLRRSLDEIVADTPQAEVAAVRIKKLPAKAGTVMGGMLRDMIVDLAGETAKKVILQ